MSVFPGAIPAAGSASPSATLAAAGHTALHNTSYDEIRALATKMGIGSSTPIDNTVLRGTATGQSGWEQLDLTSDVTGTLPVASGGTGQNSLTSLPLSSPIITGGGSWSGSPSITTPTIASFTNANHTHANAAGGGQIVSGAIPADAVNDSQMVYGKLRTRQGGSATDWQSAGTTTYDYSATNTFVQVGSILSDASPKTVTFPTAFNQKPVIVATVTSFVGSVNCFVRVETVSATQFTIQVVADTGSANTDQTVNWTAFGE